MKTNTPNNSDRSDRAGYLLIRCNDHFRTAIAQALSSVKMSVREYRILNATIANGILHNQATIAARLGMTQNALSKAVAELVERGWIYQQPNRVNRRENFVLLTEEGKRVLMNARRLSIDIQEELLAHIPKKEQEQLKRLLRKVCLTDR